MRVKWLAIVVVLVPMAVIAQPPKAPEKKPAAKTRPPLEAFTDPEKAGPDFQFQGEYVGENKTLGKMGGQVIAEGDGKFTVRILKGGLPGDGGDEKSDVRIKADVVDGVVNFSSQEYEGVIANGKLKVLQPIEFTLDRIVRQSPTIGLKSLPGAVILYDGQSSVEQWNRGRLIDDKFLRCGATTKQKFADFKLHIEFRTPFVPKARGQSRGNSGVYIQGRYEVQILDSFGVAAKNNDCGAIYQATPPQVNASFPPLTWQTFDIDFAGPRFVTGEKTADAVITVRHNGVLVQDRVKIPAPTGETFRIETGEPGPINLQDHGTPVAFRNIWLVEAK